jgi:hypothetical protein
MFRDYWFIFCLVWHRMGTFFCNVVVVGVWFEAVLGLASVVSPMVSFCWSNSMFVPVMAFPVLCLHVPHTLDHFACPPYLLESILLFVHLGVHHTLEVCCYESLEETASYHIGLCLQSVGVIEVGCCLVPWYWGI